MTDQDLTVQEFIIRSIQFCVCYLVAIGISSVGLIGFCVRDGGRENIVGAILLFTAPFVSSIVFFC
jgi:hypothetical protein